MRTIIKEYSYEPDFSPEGTVVVQAMIFTDAARCERWINLSRDRERYKAEKRICSEAMMDAIISLFPQVKDRIRCIDTWTPATYHSYFGADHGAYMGFAFTPKTPLRRYSCRLKGLENVFIATQWQCSPGGLPNAARAGKKVADEIRKIYK